MAALGAATLLVLGAPALHGSARLQAAPAFPRGNAYLAAAVSGPSAMRLPAVGVGWHGGAVTAATGEQMTIYISDGYTPEQVSQQTWADFFAGLIHGSELARLVAYVVTPTEVQQMCGLEALACAGGGRIVVPGEPQYGWAPTTVATHEYAHFIALNRSNPPWNADAFGTKRWASVAGICARVGAGTAFPGDESEHYRLNPGEAFAEVYRVLNETRAGAFSFAWSIVDSSFYPDSQALGAAEQDVRSPWLAPTAVSVSGRFLPKGLRTWKHTIVTPLDGVLQATLTIPSGGLYEFTLTTPDGKTRLASGLWSGAHTKTLTTIVCGQRQLVLHVALRGTRGRFSVRAAVP